MVSLNSCTYDKHNDQFFETQRPEQPNLANKAKDILSLASLNASTA